MLLELPHSHVPVGADKLVEWLLKQGIRPMIAHPERNKDIMRSVDKLLPFVRLGCLLQVTAGAVAGAFGEGARARAVDLLGKGWVTVLASDAHNLEARPPELEPGRAAAAVIVGEAESWNLVRHRPAEITAPAHEAPRFTADGITAILLLAAIAATTYFTAMRFPPN
jgi:protein-tyrosine phosphatase